MLLPMSLDVDAELQRPRAIDLDIEIGRIDLLLQMGVDNAREWRQYGGATPRRSVNF